LQVIKKSEGLKRVVDVRKEQGVLNQGGKSENGGGGLRSGKTWEGQTEGRLRGDVSMQAYCMGPQERLVTGRVSMGWVLKIWSVAF